MLFQLFTSPQPSTTLKAGVMVKTHINNIYAKLNVETRTQALKRWRELNLSNARNDAEPN